MEDKQLELLIRLETSLQEQEQCLTAGDAQALQRAAARGVACIADLASLPFDELHRQLELKERLEAALVRAADLQHQAELSVATLRQALAEVSRQRQAAVAFSTSQRWPSRGGAYLNEKR